MRQIRMSGSTSGEWKRSMVGYSGTGTRKSRQHARPHLNHRATPRLYFFTQGGKWHIRGEHQFAGGVSMSRLFNSACSGTMYSSAPTIWPTSVNMVRSVSFCWVALATPKSITFGTGLPS
jgi:hypothetical protein